MGINVKPKKSATSNYAWVVYIADILLFVAVGGFFNTVALYMDPVLKEFPNISRSAYAGTITLCSISSAAMNILYGKVNSKISVRRIVQIGGVCAIISIFVYSIASALWMFYLAAFIFGASLAMCAETTAAVLVSEWFARRIGTLTSIVLTASALSASIFGPLIGGWIDTFGWRQSFRYSLILMGSLIVIAAILIRSKPADMGLKPMWSDKEADVLMGNDQLVTNEEKIFSFKDTLKSFNFWCIIIFFFIISGLIYSVVSSLPILASDLGYNNIQSSVVNSCVFIGNAATLIPFGILYDKISSKKALLINIVIFLICLPILIMPNTPYVLLCAAAVLAGICYNAITLPMVVIVTEFFGSEAVNNIVGCGIGSMYLGMSIICPVFQKTYDISGSYTSSFIAYIPIMIACILFLVFGLKKRNEVPTN